MSNASFLAYPLSFSEILISIFMFWFFVYDNCNWVGNWVSLRGQVVILLHLKIRTISSVRFSFPLPSKIVNRSFNFSMVTDVKSLLILPYVVSSFSCFLLFLNDSKALKISSSNCSIALFHFINSEFQNTS